MQDTVKGFGHRLLVKRTHHPIVQLLRYGLVVLIAAPIDFFGYIALLALGLYPIVAASISFTVSLIVNYLLSVQWAFNADGKSKKTRAVIFFAIGLVGLILTDIIIAFCIHYAHVHEVPAKLIALLVVFFWSFGARRYLFKSSRKV